MQDRSEADAPDAIVTERSPLLQSAGHDTRYEDVESRESAQHLPDDDSLIEGPSAKKLILVLGSVWLGCFLSALDSTIVATLSAPISTSFNSFTILSWLASSYLIAQAAITPLSGKLTDIFGRRAGLIFANIMFGAGTLLCGLANDERVIILGRVIAGIGGGCLNSISTFIASDLIPLRRRGLWQGIANICWGLGAGIGGIYGGWINDIWGWRWAFLLQVPLIVISGILVVFTVKIPVKEKNMSRIKRVDFLGSFLLVGSLVLLLTGLNSGGNTVTWSHPLVIGSLSASAVCLSLFVYVEERVASEPMIPVRLLLNRTVAAACLTNWFSTMAQYGLFYYGPIYFQVRGYSVAESGYRLVPQAFGTAIGSMAAGYVMRVTGRYYVPSAVFEILRVIAFALVAITFNLETPDWPAYVLFFVVGLGYASMLTITLLALISAVDHTHQAVITSASYAARNTGSSIGVTIASAVFQNLLKSGLWSRFGEMPCAEDEIKHIRDSLDSINHLPNGWKGGVLDAYMHALKGVWITVLGLAVLGLISSLWMREHKLHSNLARK